MNARQHADGKRWNFALVNRLVDCVDSCYDELKMAWHAERRPDSLLHRSGGSNTRMPGRRAFSKRVIFEKVPWFKRCLFFLPSDQTLAVIGGMCGVALCGYQQPYRPTPRLTISRPLSFSRCAT
jgi:hypothetical protein